MNGFRSRRSLKHSPYIDVRIPARDILTLFFLTTTIPGDATNRTSLTTTFSAQYLLLLLPSVIVIAITLVVAYNVLHLRPLKISPNVCLFFFCGVSWIWHDCRNKNDHIPNTVSWSVFLPFYLEYSWSSPTSPSSWIFRTSMRSGKATSPSLISYFYVLIRWVYSAAPSLFECVVPSNIWKDFLCNWIRSSSRYNRQHPGLVNASRRFCLPIPWNFPNWLLVGHRPASKERLSCMNQHMTPFGYGAHVCSAPDDA